MASTSLGRLYVDLLMKIGSFETDAGRAAKIAERRTREIDAAFSKSMRNAGKAVAGFGIALVGINSAAQIGMAGVQQFFGAINNADRIAELSSRLGISAESMSVLGYAATQTGSDLDQIASAIPKLSKNIAEAADASSSAGKLFKALGIDVFDGNKQLREADELLPELSEVFKNLKNDTLAQRLAQDLLGKSGAEMLEFMRLGVDGFAAMGEKAGDLGAIISGDTAAAADQFNDQLADLKAAGNGLATQIAAELLPAMTDLTRSATEFVADGSNAALIADGISLAFSTMRNSATIAADGFSLISNAALSAAGDLGSFLTSLVYTNAELAKQRADTLASIDSISKTNTPSFGNVSSKSYSFNGRDSQLAAARAGKQRDAENRLLGLYGGEGGGKSNGGKRSGGKTGLTEEQKRAEELQRTYESLNSTMAERLAMSREEAITGKEVGEAWKVAYDIQFGSLKGLSELKAKELIGNAENLEMLKAENEVRSDLKKISDEQTERFGETLKSLQEEIDAAGMSNEQLRIRNELQRAGVELDSARGQSIAGMVKSIEAQSSAIEGLDGVRSIAHDFFVDLPNGAANAWKNALAQIDSMLLQWAAKGLIEQLFGEQGTTGKGSAAGGWISSLFSAFSSGGSAGKSGSAGSSGGGWMSMIAGLFGGGRADGGPVYGGKMHPVNERGIPELLTVGRKQLLMMPPGQNGQVTPMRAGGGLGGGFTQVINNNYSSPTEPRTQSQVAQKAGFEAQRALRRNS